MANPPQETIGKYRIIATLGFGSQGAVYRARDETLGREVALKVLHPHLATPDLIERFQREARIIASIPHPNIAGVSEIGESGGTHYIAIEYVPHSLAELMARGPMDVSRAISIAHQTALALEAARASENAITHHDVKPDNILLTSLDDGGAVKLIDFGIAHAEGMTSITQAGSQWGTPLYMPPEQWAGERGDTRSDIYSLGVVLYHMLAGHPPFDSDAANNVAKQTEIASQHQQTAAPPLRSMRGDIPEALDAIVAKCMAKPPSARYQTPGELAATLATLLWQDAPPAASIPPVRPSPPKPRNRMPLIAAAVFGAIIMAILAMLAIFQSGDTAPDLPPRIAAVALPADTPTALPPRAPSRSAPASSPTATRTPTLIEGEGVTEIVPVGATTISASGMIPPRLRYIAGSYTCALRKDGVAECWGSNSSGQSDPPAGSFVTISAGWSHTCALREGGAAECWGSNSSGQSDPPAGSFVTISAGWKHTCALREGGAAECWGNGQSAPSDESFVAISAGGGYTCALRENGAAECWGENRYGQSDSPAGSFIAISAGYNHTCALREDGEVECWGDDEYGLTDPPTGAFVAISSNVIHTCALRGDGAAECWGDNSVGQSNPPAGSFVAVSAGTAHTCALREDGEVECWGDNEYGQSNPPGGVFRR